MDVATILIPSLVLLVVLAATLSAAEVSMLRTQRVRLELAAAGGDRRAERLLAIDDDLTRGLNAILFVVLFAQVSAAAIGGYLAERWFGGFAPSIAAVGLTVVLFVYAEALPKTIAVRRPVAVALRLSGVIRVVVRAAAGPTRALLWLADLQIPGSGASARTAFTEEELRMLAQQSAQAGEIERSDAELVGRSFDFGDVTVGDILVPRRDVVAVADTTSLQAAMETSIAHGHRRLPVYAGSVDTILGIVRVRDLAGSLAADEAPPLASLVRPVVRVDAHRRVTELLREFQRTGLRFAVVEDADGTVLGIATIEDIVAELLGEIEDPT